MHSPFTFLLALLRFVFGENLVYPPWTGAWASELWDAGSSRGGAGVMGKAMLCKLWKDSEAIQDQMCPGIMMLQNYLQCRLKGRQFLYLPWKHGQLRNYFKWRWQPMAAFFSFVPFYLNLHCLQRSCEYVIKDTYQQQKIILIRLL